ncbi:MAG: histidine kinase [Coriobacteriales bacterium]|jgi:signal transduction histidine kinase|nr:histidine kinase [Coriobacteriales bacterium]
MRERVWFFFILESAMAALCLFFGFEGQGLTAFFAFTLICACLLVARLLVELLGAPAWLGWACAAACVVALFAYAPGAFLPLAVALAVDVLAKELEPRFAFALSFVVALLLVLVFPQTLGALLCAGAALALASVGVVLTRSLVRERRDLAARDGRIAALETSLKNQRAAIGAIERQGRQAERNRLAARIHDGVGHGIIGSVFMLEAAQLQWEGDPQAARASVETATENLRASLEGVRRELREERSVDEQASLERIAARLDGFAAEHPGIAVELEADGALDVVPQPVWSCIHESLLETLTNLLRHSDADRFRMRVTCRSRLLSVEFSDNGSGVRTGGAASVERGIGLAAIEERALLSGGRAFFSLGSQGFVTRLVFTLKGWT